MTPFDHQTPDAIIAQLGLTPHPEGGHYRQTWVASTSGTETGRPSATCIYFLLRAGERSHWHKVDAAEIWLWHAGHPLTLLTAETDAGPATSVSLGPDVLGHQQPQVVIPPHHWQATEARSGWGLVSCVVSPGFTFDGFTLAADGFDIPTD